MLVNDSTLNQGQQGGGGGPQSSWGAQMSGLAFLLWAPCPLSSGGETHLPHCEEWLNQNRKTKKQKKNSLPKSKTCL